MAKHRVVIVEDDEFIQKAYGLSLEKEGYEVEIVENGGGAIAFIQKKKPNLILLDIILPEKNGFQILTELKIDEKLSSIPVIIVTNLEQKSDVEKCYTLGAIDYTFKSATPIHELVKKVNIILK